MAVKRIHFLVHGTVQGVFFRAHTVEAATQHGLTGWVRNLDNGKVEGEAQGDEAVLDKFLKIVDTGPSGANVIRVDRTEKELKDGEDGFRKIRSYDKV